MGTSGYEKPGEFLFSGYLGGIACDNRGFVYVRETDGGRIQKFTEEGEYVLTIAGAARAPANWMRATGPPSRRRALCRRYVREPPSTILARRQAIERLGPGRRQFRRSISIIPWIPPLRYRRGDCQRLEERSRAQAQRIRWFLQIMGIDSRRYARLPASRARSCRPCPTTRHLQRLCGLADRDLAGVP